jgi:hypothetical protein
MSTPCPLPNPDISGIGVRTAIYAQNLLSFVPTIFALRDKQISTLNLETLKTQSTTVLTIAFAVLLSAIVQGLQHGLTSYHAAVILNLSWMNNTNLFLHILLFACHSLELRGEEVKRGGKLQPIRSFLISQTKKAVKNPVLIIGTAHLSLMSAVGVWIWMKPIVSGTNPACFVPTPLVNSGSEGLRGRSLLVYSLLLPPVLNLLVPIGLFSLPIWVCTHFVPVAFVHELGIRLTRVGLAILAIINVILIADTEAIISKNQPFIAGSNANWTFGQTLAILLLLMPIRDIRQTLLKQRSGRLELGEAPTRAGLNLEDASKAGSLELAWDAIRSEESKNSLGEHDFSP